MLTKLVLAGTLAVMASRVLNTFARTHRRRLHARPEALAAPLQTWESEGGGLPGGPATARRAGPEAAAEADDEAETALGRG